MGDTLDLGSRGTVGVIVLDSRSVGITHTSHTIDEGDVTC